jgi:hypothetical protein
MGSHGATVLSRWYATPCLQDVIRGAARSPLSPLRANVIIVMSLGDTLGLQYANETKPGS